MWCAQERRGTTNDRALVRNSYTAICIATKLNSYHDEFIERLLLFQSGHIHHPMRIREAGDENPVAQSGRIRIRHDQKLTLAKSMTNIKGK